MTEPLLALVAKTQVGFFKKRTYLLIFAKDQMVFIPADGPVGKDELLAKGLPRGDPGIRTAENAPGKGDTDERSAETVSLDNDQVSQITLTVVGSRDDNVKIRYVLEIATDSENYEFELENTGYPGMFNLNTVLDGLFGKRFTPSGG
ncbi:MAG TPA: hypothetical protein PLE01_07325 [Syntrophothermus lipocalidus]|nr:hypothetical protein [Syntrophothermus lipocalidus]